MFEMDFQMEGLMRTPAECQRRGLDLEPPLKQFGREKRKQIAALNSVTQLAKTEMTLEHQAQQNFESAAIQAAQTVSGRRFEDAQSAKSHQRGMEQTNAKAQGQRDAQREKMAAQGAGKTDPRQAPSRRLSPQIAAAPVAPQPQPQPMMPPPGGVPPGF